MQQLRDYKAFIPYCPETSLLKLMSKMQVIMDRIQTINVMDFKEKCETLTFWYDTKQSKANHITNEPIHSYVFRN